MIVLHHANRADVDLDEVALLVKGVRVIDLPELPGKAGVCDDPGVPAIQVDDRGSTVRPASRTMKESQRTYRR